MTLYHLISEQVWQNLIPLLALRPDKVVHVRSHANRWRTAAKRIQRAATEIDPKWQPTYVDAPLKSDFPEIAEMRDHLRLLHERHPAGVLNFTGGTKLAAIGAYQFAVTADIPSFYFDTERRTFFPSDNQSLPPFRPLDEVIPAITVRAGLVGHGIDGANLRFSKATEQLIAFARKAAEIRTRARVPVNRWLEEIRDRFPKWANPESDWGRVPSIALPYPEHPEAAQLADAAIDSELLRIDNCGRIYLNNPALETFSLLEGGWWELACLDELSSQQRFTDIQWSARVKDNDAEGETDLIGFNRETLKLEFFSCKSSTINKPLEHLESLRNRAVRMGGSQAVPNLMVFQCIHNQQRAHYADKCRRQRVAFWEGYPLKEVNR